MPTIHRIDEPSFRRDLFIESVMRSTELEVKRAIPASKSTMELEQEITFWQKRETDAIAQLSDDELRAVQGFYSIKPSTYLKQIGEELRQREPGVQA